MRKQRPIHSAAIKDNVVDPVQELSEASANRPGDFEWLSIILRALHRVMPALTAGVLLDAFRSASLDGPDKRRERAGNRVNVLDSSPSPISLLVRFLQSTEIPAIVAVMVKSTNNQGYFSLLRHKNTCAVGVPDLFDLGRFLTSPKPDHFVFLPFGVWPQTYIGARLAMTEAVLVLARFVRRFIIMRTDDRPAGAINVLAITRPGHIPSFELRARSNRTSSDPRGIRRKQDWVI